MTTVYGVFPAFIGFQQLDRAKPDEVESPKRASVQPTTTAPGRLGAAPAARGPSPAPASGPLR